MPLRPKDKPYAPSKKPGVRAALFALRVYQAYLSHLFAGSCRFQPTCSQYTYEAMERFGLARGSWLALRRLLRCHPFSRSFGFDPVPDRSEEGDGLARRPPFGAQGEPAAPSGQEVPS